MSMMRRPVGRLLMVLSMSGLMFQGVVSCKSPHSSEAPAVEPQQQAVTSTSAGAPGLTDAKCKNGVDSSSDLSVKVHCTQIHGSAKFCGEPGGTVTFTSTCGHQVKVTFSNSSTLFVGNADHVLVPSSGQQVLTIKSSGVTSEHCMCIGKKAENCTCDQLDSATGSLDVSTTTGPDPDDGKKPQDSQ